MIKKKKKRRQNLKRNNKYSSAYYQVLRSAYEKGKQEGLKQGLPFSLGNKYDKITYPSFDIGDKTIHGIIAARNEASTIKSIIQNSYSAGVQHVIVVANGCTDNTAKLAKAAGAEVIEFRKPLGYDVGRAIGLKHSTADINVIIDADIVFAPDDLVPFINAVANGVDIALNNLNPLFAQYAHLDKISIMKFQLNFILGLEKLGVNSLTAVPHALSKKAVQIITPEFLVVPPKAMVKASISNLRIEAVHTVDVFKPNKIRPEIHKFKGRDLAADLIIGDHLEAISYYLFRTDWRGGRTDLGRKRELI